MGAIEPNGVALALFAATFAAGCLSFFTLAGMFHFGSPAVNSAYAAAAVGLFVYTVGSVACFFLPEPKEGVILAD